MFYSKYKTLIKSSILLIFWALILSAVVIFSHHYFIKLPLAYSWEQGNYWWQGLFGWYSDLIRWDSGWYIKIANAGYAQNTLVFLPLYPLLIRLFNFLINNIYLSGLLVSWAFFVTFLVYLAKLIKQVWPQNHYFKVLFLILVFPSSFFLISLYAESLFLAVVVAAFYYFEKKQVWPVILCLALASLTKVYGLFLPILFIVYGVFYQKEVKKSSLLLISYLPAFSYFIYLFKIGFSPLNVFSNQQDWGRPLYFSNYWQTAMNYLSNFKNLFLEPSMFKLAESTDLLFFCFFILLVILSYKKISKIYSWYAILILLLPALSGTLISVKRYVLLIFPMFIYLAMVLKGKWYFLYILFNFLLLIFFFWLFVNSAWVA